MKIVLIGNDRPYSDLVLNACTSIGIEIDSVILIRSSFFEKLKLLKTILKKGGGIRGLFYYLQERVTEETEMIKYLNKRYFFEFSAPIKIENWNSCFKSIGTNSKKTIEILRKLNPDLVLIGGGIGILKSEVLATAKIGFLNGHTAKLPDYRGYSDPAHIVLNETNPVFFVTTHWINQKIDSGNILETKKVEGVLPKTLSRLLGRIRAEAAVLLSETTLKIISGETIVEKKNENGKLYSIMPFYKRMVAEEFFKKTLKDS